MSLDRSRIKVGLKIVEEIIGSTYRRSGRTTF